MRRPVTRVSATSSGLAMAALTASIRALSDRVVSLAPTLSSGASGRMSSACIRSAMASIRSGTSVGTTPRADAISSIVRTGSKIVSASSRPRRSNAARSGLSRTSRIGASMAAKSSIAVWMRSTCSNRRYAKSSASLALAAPTGTHVSMPRMAMSRKPRARPPRPLILPLREEKQGSATLPTISRRRVC